MNTGGSLLSPRSVRTENVHTIPAPGEHVVKLRLKLPLKRLRRAPYHAGIGRRQKRKPVRVHGHNGRASEVQDKRALLSERTRLIDRKWDDTGPLGSEWPGLARDVGDQRAVFGLCPRRVCHGKHVADVGWGCLDARPRGTRTRRSRPYAEGKNSTSLGDVEQQREQFGAGPIVGVGVVRFSGDNEVA